MSDFLKHRMNHILDGRPKEIKKRKPIRKNYVPKVKDENDQTEKQKWFDERRPEMTGTCQCGCRHKSSKYDDLNFRSSICHILPQKLFKSVIHHPLNWVERNYWNGCHANMDNRSIELWISFADWEEIKRRFWILSDCLTEKEKTKKFYNHLKSVILAN
jgi:hypothetical protein